MLVISLVRWISDFWGTDWTKVQCLHTRYILVRKFRKFSRTKNLANMAWRLYDVIFQNGGLSSLKSTHFIASVNWSQIRAINRTQIMFSRQWKRTELHTSSTLERKWLSQILSCCLCPHWAVWRHFPKWRTFFTKIDSFHCKCQLESDKSHEQDTNHV